MEQERTYPTPRRVPAITSDVNGRVVKIADQENRRAFTFRVGRGEIDVEPGPAPRGNPDASTDWREALTPYEKVNVMNLILAQYRQRSRHKQVKVASIGLTTTGNLYLRVNGHIASREGTKHCSEQKVLLHGEEQEADKDIEAGREPRDFQWEEFYVEGGREPDWHIMGPCGDCTDMLSKAMIDGGKIWVLPANYGKNYIDITDKPKWIGEVPENECWATDINFLTRNRIVGLGREQQMLQYNGRATLVGRVRELVATPRVKEDPNLAVFGISGDGLSAVQDEQREALTRNIDSRLLNTYMHDQIAFTIANRLQGMAKSKRLGPLQELSDDTLSSLIESELRWVRCAVVQRDDGKLFASVTVRKQDEKSSDIAETNAIGQGMRKAGTERFRDLWCMEFHPQHLKEGKMRTSAQSAIERLIKWASLETGMVDFHYMPFNTGQLTVEEVDRNMVHFSPHELHPSLHSGTPEQGKSVADSWVGKTGGRVNHVGNMLDPKGPIVDGAPTATPNPRGK